MRFLVSLVILVAGQGIGSYLSGCTPYEIVYHCYFTATGIIGYALVLYLQEKCK